MRPKSSRKPLVNDTPKVRRAPGAPTKSQLRALANAEAQARVAKWKTLLTVAGAVWNKLHAADLARSNGDFNVIAGLVQMHHRVSREEANSQVRSFFDQYGLSTPLVQPRPIVVPVSVVAPEVISEAAPELDVAPEASTTETT